MLSLWLMACQVTAVATPIPPVTKQAALAQLPTAAPTQAPTNTPIATITASATAVPPTYTATATTTPTSTSTPTPTITPSATPVGICGERVPPDDLLTIVTLTYNLGRRYQPADLVPLSDYFPVDVTLGYPSEIRQVAIGPLVQLMADMHEAGLKPTIISGYRSFDSQVIARDKWSKLEPENVNYLSAPPGYSEHQLGTVVDFGSPELPEVVGRPDVEFHTYFYKTSEGQWLLEHAHEYGFTLSYPREAFDITGFFYEPWHFRYIGVELATRLREQGLSLTEYQLATMPLPCIPETE
jgi:D-alanyl-D-alanine carboxypeptidase